VALVLISAVAFGATSLLVSIQPDAVLYTLFLVPVGLAIIMVTAAANTTMQTGVEPEMRGRVMSIYMLVFLGGTPVGSPLVGWVGQHLGPRWSVGGGGAIAAVALDDQGNAAATCRAGGEICRKAGECCSGTCSPPDRTGRSYCTCQANTAVCGATCCSVPTVCVKGRCVNPTSTPTSTSTSTPTQTATGTASASLTCNPVITNGPPAQATNTFQDTANGIISIVVTRSENADTPVPPFTPGTTDPVTVTSTKIDQSRFARVTFQVTDSQGTVFDCDFTFPSPPISTCSNTIFDSGPPATAQSQYQDASGIAEIAVTQSENADTVVPPFTANTTSPVTVTSTKINQSQLAEVAVQVTYGSGFSQKCVVVF